MSWPLLNESALSRLMIAVTEQWGKWCVMSRIPLPPHTSRPQWMCFDTRQIMPDTQDLAQNRHTCTSVLLTITYCNNTAIAVHMHHKSIKISYQDFSQRCVHLTDTTQLKPVDKIVQDSFQRSMFSYMMQYMCLLSHSQPINYFRYLSRQPLALHLQFCVLILSFSLDTWSWGVIFSAFSIRS